VDRALLASLVAGVSRLATSHPEIVEIDLNPVIATRDRVVAVDALVVLGES
jgi:acetyltransferase